MIDNAKTGAYIAYLRQRAGMTQTQLAVLMNVTHQAVSKWENGSALPDMQTMLNLSAVFGVTIEEMLVVPDGVFGVATENAVRAYQRVFGIEQTGIVGSVSWNSILDTYITLTDGGDRQAGQFPG